MANARFTASGDEALRKAIQEQVINRIDHARLKITYYNAAGSELLWIDFGRVELGDELTVEVAERGDLQFDIGH
jgi:homogentisate 1,2-dioxygenase